ncbi:hypothetical protein C8J57DRAFT_1705773 [Mycena rebaudengoi]|nr:hypothetical protein C8J57DRAFT_1705773 [Mycena rebaudengoi]
MGEAAMPHDWDEDARLWPRCEMTAPSQRAPERERASAYETVIATSTPHPRRSEPRRLHRAPHSSSTTPSSTCAYLQARPDAHIPSPQLQARLRIVMLARARPAADKKTGGHQKTRMQAAKASTREHRHTAEWLARTTRTSLSPRRRPHLQIVRPAPARPTHNRRKTRASDGVFPRAHTPLPTLTCEAYERSSLSPTSTNPARRSFPPPAPAARREYGDPATEYACHQTRAHVVKSTLGLTHLTRTRDTGGEKKKPAVGGETKSRHICKPTIHVSRHTARDNVEQKSRKKKGMLWRTLRQSIVPVVRTLLAIVIGAPHGAQRNEKKAR